VKEPRLFKDIVTLNMVKDVKVDGSTVFVMSELTTPACPLKETIKRDVEAAVKKNRRPNRHIGTLGQHRARCSRERPLRKSKTSSAVGAGKEALAIPPWLSISPSASSARAHKSA